MKNVVRNGLSLWEFDTLSTLSGVRHFVTDRNTHPTGESFTLSYSSTHDRALVVNNRRLLAEAMRVDEHALFLPSQVHQTRIVHVSPGTTKQELLETDALVTSHPGLCIAVMSADCVPIILYDIKHQVIAAVHSGWRGTVARILEKTLRELSTRYGTSGRDVIAGIGPSVSQASYEVGAEVISAVEAAFDTHGKLLVHTLPQKARLDLWSANRQQLLEFGVPEAQIEISNLCTVIHNHAFYSARKGDSGRFAAGIVLSGKSRSDQ